MEDDSAAAAAATGSSANRKRQVQFRDRDEVRQYEPEGKRAARHAEDGLPPPDGDEEEEHEQEQGREQQEPEGEQANRSAAGLRARQRDKLREESHTLDSDEDEGEDKMVSKRKYKLTDEDIHEQLDNEFQDGGFEVTGFNLNEELEEGHFDENGNFIFHKDEEHEGDKWLDGMAVFNPKRPVQLQGKQHALDEDSIPDDKFDLIQEITKLVQPHESVTQALTRLSGSKPGSRRRPDQQQGGAKHAAEPANPQAVERLTHLAGALLAQNMFDIYETTFERLQLELKNRNAVRFEFKWTEDEDAELHGPFLAEEMLAWQQGNYFGDGVWVRQLKKEGAKFYHSSRIDFELFTGDD